MGLLDVLNGMQNGPRGQPAPSSTGSSRGGMSPIATAVLGLLAYKAVKSFGGGQPSPNSAGTARTGQPASPPGGTTNTGMPGSGSGSGGLGNLLKGGLGSLLASGAAGGVLSGGLNDLLKQFQQSGQGDVASSWVGKGPNKTIAANDLAKVLGADRINTLMENTGMSRDELIASLSQALPEAVNQLTPEGRVPTEQELSRSL
ncbi:MAG TPA: YidB family protein [Terriglobales bacterium]|nr:YidB family protein [Terriglobales bacterium]